MSGETVVHESAIGEEPQRVALAAVSAEPTEGAPVPKRVLLVPWGEVSSAAGTFVLDKDAAELTLAAFESHGTDLPIDYEHQTLGGEYSSPTGQAPAAGWIRKLTPISPEDAGRDGRPAAPGLWADVTWTSEGAERLSHREYRYLSPVALVRRTDRRLVGLHSAALTNKPAIVGMQPVVNRIAAPHGASGSAHLKALRIALSLDCDSDESVVLLKAVGRIRELERAETRRRAEERVANAMSDGKLTPAQRAWALSLAQRDPEEFDRWAADAPCVVVVGRLSAPEGIAHSATGAGKVAEAAAREEWRANRSFLEKLCSEDAYAAAAARETESLRGVH